MNKITFNLGQNGLGSVEPGTDYISGYLIYRDSVPSGFTGSIPKMITSLSQAEGYGILGDYSDEIRATASIVCSATGSVGDTLTISISEPSVTSDSGLYSQTIQYTRQSSDSTLSNLATNIANAINASGTGYSATALPTKVTLSARPGMGIGLNSGTRLTLNLTGAMSVSVDAQFTGGVASTLKLLHYQISEFFRLAPNAILYVAFYPTSDTTYTSINDMVAQSNGEIKQLMVAGTSTSTSTMLSDMDLIQAQCSLLQSLQMPISVIYANNLYGTSDLSTLPNTRAKSDNYVSAVIGQDGAGLGAWLSITNGKAVPQLGTCLGTIAKNKVSDSIAWVGQNNISNGVECEVAAFVNGQKYKFSNVSLYNQLDNYGYLYVGKFQNRSGSYWNSSSTAISVSSDYSYIERNRTIGKCQRLAYSDLLPLLNGPVYFNNDGTIATVTQQAFEGAVLNNLEAMKNNNEISNYEVTVDTTSNVQSTGVLNITIKIIGVGVARNITVYLGYTKSI